MVFVQKKKMKDFIEKIKFKYDVYTKSRDNPALLKLTCSYCNHLIIFYQKDGPGLLKRCYLDRILYPKENELLQHLPFNEKVFPNLTCQNCKQIIGYPYLYEKEKRPSFKLVQEKFNSQEISLNF
jgi:hypothetical protein